MSLARERVKDGRSRMSPTGQNPTKLKTISQVEGRCQEPYALIAVQKSV